jgi:hypothetical protein
LYTRILKHKLLLVQIRIIVCTLLFVFFLLGCKKTDNNQPIAPKTITDNFTSGTDGWLGDFADYPTDPAQTPQYQLEFTHTVLPDPLNTTDGALKQSGMNRSDDLFMFIKKKITGLEPGRNYTIDVKVDFATNAADNMIGVGGAPGEGVTIKAGAVSVEPIKIANTLENYYRMNIDKSNQSQGGVDMKVIGNFANGTDLNIYKIKQLSTTTALDVRANQQGEIWLVIGTDSGFEGMTTIYYNTIQATIK